MPQSLAQRKLLGLIRKALKLLLAITHGLSSASVELGVTTAARKIATQLNAEETAAWQTEGVKPEWLDEDCARRAFLGDIDVAEPTPITTEPSARRRSVRAQDVYFSEHRARLHTLFRPELARKQASIEFNALDEIERYEYIKKASIPRTRVRNENAEKAVKEIAENALRKLNGNDGDDAGYVAQLDTCCSHWKLRDHQNEGLRSDVQAPIRGSLYLQWDFGERGRRGANSIHIDFGHFSKSQNNDFQLVF
jgi:hypothetical protein